MKLTLGHSPDADDAPLSPRTLEQLAWVGMDADSRRKLEPWLTFLPTVTPVNFNTGTITLNFANARCWFSKAPPHSIQ